MQFQPITVVCFSSLDGEKKTECLVPWMRTKSMSDLYVSGCSVWRALGSWKVKKSGEVSHRLTFTWWGCCGLCPWHKPTELARSFYSALVSVSVFMALSTAFHSLIFPGITPLSHSVLLVLFLPYWSFQRYMFLCVSPDVILCGWLGLKHQLSN